MLYPQANWVEVSQGTPYYLIGESAYGKPILDRALTYERSMDYALKVGHLAFDSTRRAATDVDYPIDIVLYRRDSFSLVEQRYNEKDLHHVGDWWQQHLSALINELPSEWVDELMTNLTQPVVGRLPDAS
jgi:putative proteasome-type protease